ncbi:MAG: hypothetical protein VB092_04990 [Oscillospiraceae bacterium]|nr:hypothetical protein [Oscillospiraceae bacterium]
MIRFYCLPSAALVGLSFFAAVTALLGAAAALYGILRSHHRSKMRYAQDALQLTALLQTLLMLYCVAFVHLNRGVGSVLLPELDGLRCAVFILLAGLGAVCAWEQKRLWPLSAALAALPTLPVCERIEGAFYPAAFALALLVLSLRAVRLLVIYRREFDHELTAFTINDAINALHSGVLFYAPDGAVLLCNRRMRRLMLALCGGVCRDAKAFYTALASDAPLAGERIRMDGGVAFRLPDGGVWLFARTAIETNGHEYVQLAASEITERFALTKRLIDENEQLRERSEALKTALQNIGEICRDEETARLKSRFHDMLGQRVALLLRGMRAGERIDRALLDDLRDGIDLERQTQERDARCKLRMLRRLTEDIGVRFIVSGELPDTQGEASVCADILTEAVTNAVRHGFASEIHADMEEAGGEFRLRITNDGPTPEGLIKEGGGLSGMREKLAPLGGRLEVETSPRFVLTARFKTGVRA